MTEPLQVALIHRKNDRATNKRMVGWWSYPVPEFDWIHFPVDKGFRLRRDAFNGYDLIVYEDGKLHGTFTGTGPPIAYTIVDSTLSDEHYRLRLEQAKQCDLLLVDWDRLDRFTTLGKPVRRFPHAVNDRVMRDHHLEKEIDVGSYQNGTTKRRQLEDWLRRWCKERGYVFEAGTYGWLDYAIMMNRSKIIVNLARNPETRNHRLFDAMACHACVLTDPPPVVDGDCIEAGTHYVQFRDVYDLEGTLPSLLEGDWLQYATAGHDLIYQQHTWQVRAQELRAILAEELGL